MGFAVLASVSCILAWGVHAVTGSRPAGYTLDDRQRSELPDRYDIVDISLLW